ncbi:MAG TPA: cysteine--tRNA ligase [Candidatus Saccharimonadales bacterium]|nr:cysteine--tRNA ligase [Candidatus Saccharimonadales bacterium]
MKLYNTLTRTVEEIKPQNPGHTSVYTCGPTVYDYPHVGNWFTFIRYDLLVRALRSEGQNVAWVMNITDVGHLVNDADTGEDKLEKGARREGKTAWDVAKFYGDYFVKGLERLDITTPTKLPKATEHIAEQIELVKTLEAKGYTYIIDDGVYYDTGKFEGYAAFARLDLDEQQAGARVGFNAQKRNAADFALWKFSPKNHTRDMEWDSPWGKGFPGWHVECSAMSMKYLGETIDIHSGGIDHVPVHHTNEIAQSEAATGKRFANYWMHTNHILINGDKISKSLGNGITLEDIEQKDYSLEAFRLLVLQSHYRTQSKFSWEELDAAENRLKTYQAFADLRWQPIPESAQSADVASTDYEQYLHDIFNELTNDLNTPKALAILSQIADTHAEGIPAQEHESFEAFLDAIDHMLGLRLLQTDNINDAQKKLVLERQMARRRKDWATSDRLRDELASQGIGLRDTSHGPIWCRI